MTPVIDLAARVAEQRRVAVARLQDTRRAAVARSHDLYQRRARQAVEAERMTEERRLIDCGIPGFFPTPQALARRLVSLADIRTGMTVLEPSAGTGNIAD